LGDERLVVNRAIFDLTVEERVDDLVVVHEASVGRRYLTLAWRR